MSAAIIYFVVSLVLLVLTARAYLPRLLGPILGQATEIPLMVLLWFVPQWILVGISITLFFGWIGALAHPLGRLGLGIHILCWLGLLGHLVRARAILPFLDGKRVADDAAVQLPDEAQTGTGQDEHPTVSSIAPLEHSPAERLRPSLLPILSQRIPEMRQVEVTRSVIYREVGRVRLKLDVYHPAGVACPLPCVLYIHGGGWAMGTRRQSPFMCNRLAAAGWVVFAASYRLAPRFPLPAAVEDCKAALVWVRDHSAEYGGDGAPPVVIGGSAGGHLAAMMAFTQGVAKFQPGFEDADTRVRAAVLLYPVLDFEGPFLRGENRGLGILLERVALRTRYRDDPDRYRELQPIQYADAGAPPVLVVHGECDSMVPIVTSRALVSKLRSCGAHRVHLLEVPGALHAFEVFTSPYEQRAVRVIAAFLESVRGSEDSV